MRVPGDAWCYDKKAMIPSESMYFFVSSVFLLILRLMIWDGFVYDSASPLSAASRIPGAITRQARRPHQKLEIQLRIARWSPLGIFSLLVSSICAVHDRLVSKMKDAINKANQPFTFRVPLNEYGENNP